MLYCFKKSKNATETHKKIHARYGEGAVTDRTCQKWFLKFCAGDFSLDDAPQLSGPAEVDRDQIETLTENNQHYTMQKIADILKRSKSIKLLVKMKTLSFILWTYPIRTLWPTQYRERGFLKARQRKNAWLSVHKPYVWEDFQIWNSYTNLLAKNFSLP